MSSPVLAITTRSSPSSSRSPRASFAPPVPPASRTTCATGGRYIVIRPDDPSSRVERRLAELTTLRLGGPAEVVAARTEAELIDQVRAGALVLAGGSNVVI